MSEPKLSISFLALFADLRSRTNNEPKRISAFARDSKSISELVGKLASLQEQIETALLRHKQKYFVTLPEGFAAAWKDYKERWANIVLKENADQLFRDLGIDPDSWFGLGDEKGEANTLAPPDYNYESSFAAREHDPSYAIEQIFQRCTDQLPDYENAGIMSDSRLANLLRIGIQAWDYLTEVIGFDSKEVASRWQQIPPVFVPRHIANQHGLSDRDLLYLRLDNAVRAYVFGAPLAAIAMCRALCEMVLIEHYRQEPEDLKQIIFRAEAAYPWISRLKLQTHRRRANAALHKNSLSQEQYASALGFLVVVKELIERAPGQKKLPSEP